MKNIGVLILGVSLSALSGCGHSKKSEANKAVEAMHHSFDAASAELKSKYQEAKSAVESNDFAKAKAGLDQLQLSLTQMTPEQQQAFAELRQTLMINASAAAQKGDENALKLMQALRSQSRSR